MGESYQEDRSNLAQNENGAKILGVPKGKPGMVR